MRLCRLLLGIECRLLFYLIASTVEEPVAVAVAVTELACKPASKVYRRRQFDYCA